MKKTIISIISLIVVVISFILINHLQLYYQPAQSMSSYPIKQFYKDDTTRILFMGDSWAAYHHEYDNHLADLISSQTERPCKVKSVGYVGAKSKEIYERLFTTSKQHILNNPDYCIISAGINDAVAKMGPNYYITNYILLIKFLVNNNITPVIIDMPDIDYHSVYKKENWIAKVRHQISSIITGSDFYSFHTYRIALLKTIAESEWSASIIYLSTEKWKKDKDYFGLFREDRIHLNKAGYRKLDKELAAIIIKNPPKRDISTIYPQVTKIIDN